jgi:hypothetical protein
MKKNIIILILDIAVPNSHNQAYYGDHWLFTNIERKATLDIEIFQ